MTRLWRNPFAGGSGSQSPNTSARMLSPGGALFAAAVILAPALLLWHLHRLWNLDGAYAYGWVTPLLAVYLFKSRWDVCPAPSAPIKAGLLAILFALIAIPTHWLHEAAPERSICAWVYAAASIGISLSLISVAGGTAWLRWFSFPFVFLLTAVPWPHTLETLVSTPLMRCTAGATVEILCLIGVPSVQAGNLVHIETGVIDIDEACSGIRSLQAMVMMSLFLGELIRLRLAGRLALIVIGLAITLMANVIRTVVLSSIGFSQGMGAVDHFHDAAGLAVLTLSMSSTLFTAFLLRPKNAVAPSVGASGFVLTLPLKLSAALLLLLLAGEIAVEGWYRLHEPKWQGWSWFIQWPQGRDAFQMKEIPKRSLRLLMCDESHAATWKETDGSDWSLYWIRWHPGNAAAEMAKVHRPDVCLNAEGAVMEKDLGMDVISVGGRKFPFHRYTFRIGDKTLFVFFCLTEEIAGDPAIESIPTFEAIDVGQRALKGWRRIGLQSLEFAASGCRSELSSQEDLKGLLAKLIHTGHEAAPTHPPADFHWGKISSP